MQTTALVLGVGLLALVLWRLHKMSVSLDRLTTEVSENTSVIESAIVLIEGLAQALRDAAADPAAVNALADRLDAQSNALASAVAANTPTPPEPPPAGEDTTTAPA